MLMQREASALQTGAVPAGPAVRRAFSGLDNADAAIAALRRDLGDVRFALILIFVAPRHDRAAIGAAIQTHFAGEEVIGCTTAGEICDTGYETGQIVAIGFPAADFVAETCLINQLSEFDVRSTMLSVLDMRGRVGARHPDWQGEFAMFFSDGLSRMEDRVVSAISTALASTPLFGGSAGDGLDFRQTHVMKNGSFHGDAAVMALLRTRCGVRVFRFDHFVPTGRRMVVTEAVPEERLVRQINAEPAAREYARLVGAHPDDLTPQIFAAHPVMVRIGGRHHVRSIQKQEANGDLRFYSAVDEGLVLTVAEPLDMARHLDEALSAFSARRRPDAIIGCDCILRRLEAESRQATGEVSRILARHGVIGFNTYGEQHGMAHVNQTFTGVAIYAPEEDSLG